MEEKYSILFEDEKGFKWYKTVDAAVKGGGWFQGIYYEGDAFLRLILAIKSKDMLVKTLRELNGSFSGYLRIDNILCVFVDHIASMPLFYDEQKRIVADNTAFIDTCEFELDEVAVAEIYKTAMYACNERTVSKSVKQVMAGNIVYIDLQMGCSCYKYYGHRHRNVIYKKNKQDYLEDIDSITVDVFSRFIKSINGRTVIVPLSGGYDSRFIVTMLKRLNYANVVCYTYGFSEDTYETGISRKVAEKLGYKHFFVKTDEKMWGDFFSDSVVQSYLYYGYNHSNLPHIQEIMALKILRENDEFPKEGVVVPGFCGDIFGGSYTLAIPQDKEYDYNKDLVVEYLFENHFIINPLFSKYDDEIKKDIKIYIDSLDYDINDLESFNSAQEEWFTSHKIAHFILPCLKSFEYFGYSWSMPLWDKKLIEFWYDIPMEYKQEDSLYDYSLMELCFEKNDVVFQKQKRKQKRYIRKVGKSRCKKVVYGMIMYIYYTFGKMFYFGRESNNFDFLCRQCYKRLENRSVIQFADIVRFETLALWWLENRLTPNIVKKIFNKQYGKGIQNERNHEM